MRICVLSDVSGPTNPAYPGHGLGQATHRIATGLLQRGHHVTLVASEGSVFDGELISPVPSGMGYESEPKLAKAAYQIHKQQPFDAFLDCGHVHYLSALFPHLPVVNVYHDIFQPPAPRPVVMSEGQKALMEPWADNAVAIHNTVDAAHYPFAESAATPPYVLFLGIVRDYKQPMLAIEATARAGIRLKMAGSAPGLSAFFTTGNTEYVGMVSGAEKTALIQGASALLQFGVYESFGLTTVEANLCGVPVVAWPSGGTVDLVAHGVNGAYVSMSGDRTVAAAAAIQRALSISRAACREHALRFTDITAQVAQYEQVLMYAAGGVVW